MDATNQGTSEYRKDTGVDIYEKDDGRLVVGYNQVGDWLEYTVNVAEDGEYTMSASVASANETSGFKLSMDGKDITDSVNVPKGEGDDNYDDYKTVDVKVNLTKGEHILRFIVLGDWMDIDYIEFGDGKCSGDCKADTSTTALSGMKIAQNTSLNNAKLKVFGVTGQFLGNVANVDGDIVKSLEMAGFAKGVYLVRNGAKTFRAQVAK